MLWIKRNILLLVGIVVSVILLGGAAFWANNSYNDDADRNDELTVITNKMAGFLQGTYPNKENIEAVKSNTVAFRQLMASTESVFPPATHKSLNARQFQVMLPNALDQLRREATNAHVEVQPRFNFTFGELLVLPSVVPYAIEPLLTQLDDIRTICHVLFEAKVRGIDSLSRVPAWAQDPGGADLLLDLPMRTNALSSNSVVTVTPYRFVFRGFSSELAAALNGFARSKEFLVVRQVDVDSASSRQDLMPFNPFNPDTPPMVPGAMPSGLIPGMIPGMGAGMATAGAGTAVPPTRPPPPPRPGAVPVAAAKPALTPILDEKTLRVTMWVDVVKLVRRPVPAAR